MRNIDLIKSYRETLASITDLGQSSKLALSIRHMESQEFSEIDEQGIFAKMKDLLSDSEEWELVPVLDLLIKKCLLNNLSATYFIEQITQLFSMFDIDVTAEDLYDDGLITRNPNFVDNE